MVKKRIVVGGAVAVTAVGFGIWAAPMAADPDGPKDCGGVGLGHPNKAKAVASTVPEPQWAQLGGTINDESCLNRTSITGIVAPSNEKQVAETLAYARANKLSITPAGAKHSMGGQAFAKGGVVIDMRRMNAIHLDEVVQTITVGAGARWHDIQNKIHPRFAIKAMQSTDVFTVGGSIAVNAHGMDHRAGALMGSVRSLRVMLADGNIVTASRTENPELFRHVIGGYGLFGIVLEAVLDVVPNDIYQSAREVIVTKDFPKTFAALEADPKVGLTYTHLSTAPGNLLEEALVYSYAKVPDEQGLERAPLSEVGSVKLRRLTVNLSKRADWFKSLKWWSEKNIEHRIESCTVTRAQAMKDGEACLVSRNDPMHDSVPYLYNNLPKETEVLHEYFVPRERILPLISGMRALFRKHRTNLVNASIRAVDREDNALSYAPQPAFSVVLYITQSTDKAGNAEMALLTRDLIDLTAEQGGRFFLPYQLHYTPEQLRRSYPEFDAFITEKKKWDPDSLFRNSWYDRYAAPAISAPVAARG